MTAPTPDPWCCAWCGAAYPVQSLARECEDRHLTDTEENL